MRGVNKELPQGWVEATIDDLTIDKIPQTVPSSASLFTYIDISGIDNESKQITPKQLPGDQAPSRARQLIRVQDVLVSMTRPNLNAVAIVPDELDNSIASTGFDVLRAIEIEPRWLFSHVRSQEFVREMAGLVQGALYPAIKSGDVRSYCIPVPPLNEQKRIVARIEELQARSRRAREALETVPDLLEQLRQSLLVAAFRGDLTKEWRENNPDVEPASELLKHIRTERRKRWEEAELEKLKSKGLIGERLEEESFKRRKPYKEPVPVDETGLSDLPDSWCWASAEELTQIITDGEHQTPPRSSSGVPLLSARNIQNGYLSLEEVDYVPEAVYETIKKRLEVEAGDVLMSCSGSLGRTSVIEERARFAMVRSVALLRPVLNEMGQFLSYGIMSPFLQAQIDSKKTQTAQANIFQGKIKTLVFPMPGLQEQKRICEIVADALKRGDDQKEKVIATLTSVDQLDQSIIAKAFRGGLVPQDSNDEPASVLLERIREEKARKATEQKANLEKRGMKRMIRIIEGKKRDILAVLLGANRAMTPEEVFETGGFDEESVDAFYEQLRSAVVIKRVREIRKGDSIMLEAVKA